MSLITFFFRRSHKHRQGEHQPVQEGKGPGRRYREDVPYALPKDLEEGNRLHLQHYLFRFVLQGNYAAPLNKEMVEHILDIGSGTGIWGHEMAQRFPHARVFGLDLEPPQTVSISATVAMPANYHFLQGNVLQGLPFPDHSFDFTHMRMLCAAIPDKDWPGVLRELVRVTKPGGWIELLEVYDLHQPGPATKHIFDLIQRALSQKGITLSKFEHLDRMLMQAGLRDVNYHSIEIPLSWGGHVGQLMEKDTIAGFSAFQSRLCEAFQISPQQCESWLAQIPKECKHYKSSFRFALAFAQVR